MMTEEEIKHWKKMIWNFYEKHGRVFAWRQTRNPYNILVSEMMLQQTQTGRVVEKYEQFLKKFPTIEDLASAPQATVLRSWQGLGYNRRALFLHRAAQEIVGRHNGKIAKDEKTLVALPGIGPYTAAAILAFAYDIPTVFIETNIRRVYIHHFFENKKKIDDTELIPLIKKTLDIKNPREWYWALMDYGATLPRVTKKNANRQSKQYAVQSKFKGSLREARGGILKILNSNEGNISLAKLSKIMKMYGIENERFQKALSALEEEGFIEIKKGKIGMK